MRTNFKEISNMTINKYGQGRSEHTYQFTEHYLAGEVFIYVFILNILTL